MSETELDEVPGSIVPRPRPGFRSAKPKGISVGAKSALVAALLRTLTGLVCLAGAVLYMPVHRVTPILTGVSIVMLVTGTYSLWRVGIDERRLRQPTRVLSWVIPGLAGVILLLAVVFGFGSLGPDWTAMPLSTDDGRTVEFQSPDAQ